MKFLDSSGVTYLWQKILAKVAQLFMPLNPESIVGGNYESDGADIGASDYSIAFGYAENGYYSTTISANGQGAIALGYTTGNNVYQDPTIRADSDGSVAMGFASCNGVIQATNNGAHAFGTAEGFYEDEEEEIYSEGIISASGVGSMATGYVNGTDGDDTKITASGKGSFAGGYVQAGATNESTGEGSFAYGINGVGATGNGSMAVGSNAQANDTCAISLGGSTSATSPYAFACGYGTYASANYSYAEGYMTKATSTTYNSNTQTAGADTAGYYSHAEGNVSIACGSSSHAEGKKTLAKGIASHAEGYLTVANGNYSHADGQGTLANSTNTHAGGLGTTANTAEMTAIGRYNDTDVGLIGGTYLFTVGNGTSSSNKSNAFSVTTNGATASHMKLAGGPYQGEGDPEDYDGGLLSFGDGMNCYIQEDSTDHMHIYGSDGINLDGNGADVTVSDGNLSVTNGRVNALDGFFQTSDIRKKNVLSGLDLDKAYDLIDKCQSILYTLKEDKENKVQIGMIAQEVQEFFPEIVSESADGTLSLDYARLTVVILRVLKDLIARIKKLELR